MATQRITIQKFVFTFSIRDTFHAVTEKLEGGTVIDVFDLVDVWCILETYLLLRNQF